MDRDAASKVVLREGVTRDDIDDAMQRCGWRMTNVYPSSDKHPGQVIYATRDRRSMLYLVEDLRLGVLYFTGTGPTVEQALSQVRAELPVVTPDDAVELLGARAEPGSYGRALAVIVLTAGEKPSDGQLEAVLRALASKDPAVRNAALVATTYAPWPELQARITELASQDREPTVRANAERVLDALYGR